jgi:nitrite reductase (NO-forming)
VNNNILVNLVASISLSGLVLCPIFADQSWAFPPSSPSQPMTTGANNMTSGGLGPVFNQGHFKKVVLIANETVVQVSPDNALYPGGIKYNAMVFNGTIPGPVIAVDKDDNLNITLINRGKLVHSMTIQAGFGTSQANSGIVMPGESKTWTLKAVNAGAFLYYGAADAFNGVWEHVASGEYGGIIVHSVNEVPAKEFYMVFSEIYNTADKGLFIGTNGKVGSFDIAKFVNDQPDLVLTNGMAFKYIPSLGSVAKIALNANASVFKVKPGELTRWYIVNAGPRNSVAFNFVGTIIEAKDGSIAGNYDRQLSNGQTWNIPPGSASVIEAAFPQPGLYIGIDHDFGRFLKGGAFAVLAINNSTATDHPMGTWVPPKNSSIIGGEKQSG